MPSVVRDYVARKRRTKSVFAVEGAEFTYDEVTMKVNMNGKERTIDVGDPNKIRPRFDLDNLSFGADGHPTFDSVSAAAHDILNDINASLYGSRNVSG